MNHLFHQLSMKPFSPASAKLFAYIALAIALAVLLGGCVSSGDIFTHP
ncbi:MAG: hypothetical protein Q4A62_02880 [Eikenella sp.]|nr:hypothetical protein [Eikenella sp.]